LDVVELDTASNRGIEDIRALRETINLAPVLAKKKVYIMDEAHMLTPEAANAFLKTLEEPPEHAIFILATTDPQKLPLTVRSRLTVVQFQKARSEELIRPLKRITRGEKLKVEEGVLGLITSRADGSLRDAVKMLESLVLAGGRITKKRAEKLLASNLKVSEVLLRLIMDKEVKKALALIKEYSEDGGSARDLVDSLQVLLRERLIRKPNIEVISLIKSLFEVRGNIARSHVEELPLEIAIIEWCGPLGVQGLPAKAEPKAMRAGKKKAPQLVDNKAVSNGVSISAEVWARILAETKNKNVSLEALLRSARPVGVNGNTLSVAVYYRFHKERLETEQYRKMFEGIVGEVLGIENPRIMCTLEDLPKTSVQEPERNSLTEAVGPDIIKAAEEIFGE
jgi:DNA polymerase-3 subunit gamma/tau